MNSKVSVIVPNYNGSKYINDCINSIINQSYKNIEIIIIDDGSIDDSWIKIKDICKKNKNIVSIKQVNMNAAIARNKGIDIATGKYVFFMDSDDILFETSIEDLVNKIEIEESDLAIGNFISIDTNENIIKNYNIINENLVCNSPINYAGIVPNPSNKLFKMDIIKENNIYFGNVRIGQDLNFFLKYIIFCRKISLINKNIYKWRIIETSMSNTYNFRIFDIVEAFKDIRRFYDINNKYDLYQNYIKIIEYRHYYLQMEKQKYFKSKEAKKIVIDYFKFNLNSLKVKECLNFNLYISDYKRCKIKLKLGFLYKSNLYYYLDKINKRIRYS